MRSSMRSSCRGVGGEEQPNPFRCCRRAISTKGSQGTRSTYRSGNRVGVWLGLGLGLSVNEHRQTDTRKRPTTEREINSPGLKAHPPPAVGFGIKPFL
jgi:hypothetical protein